MGLKVGMYIRTFDGKIGKIEYIDDILIDCDNEVYDDFLEIPISLEKKLIKNASHNIVDLIEIGDYVNGEEIAFTKDTFPKDSDKLNEEDVLFTWRQECESFHIGFKADEIKSVVTKEQFENMAYKVRD